MKIGKHIFILYVFLSFLKTQAQTFFTEDFNSYPAGHLNAIYDNTTPGKGGWLVGHQPGQLITAMVTPEAGKGNVLTISTTSTKGEGLGFSQERGFLATLWNNRTPGNNIFKFEYEFYGGGTFNFVGHILNGSNVQSISGFISTSFQAYYYYRIGGGYFESTSSGSPTFVLKNYTATTFPYNMWIKAEMFVDFNANNVYFYIPTLNIQVTKPISHNAIPYTLDFSVGSIKASSVVKIDNIKISGLKTLPSYILSVNQQLATKFNLYPNPASSVVNITNADNMQVNQITVYTLAGKQLSTQAYNNQAEIQLNVEHLASGTYLLYIQTAQGIAVKQLIKK